MSPIKFENDLKEKLEKRRVQPSVHAWETLQKRLDANESKKSHRSFWRLAIAASFVGILIVSSIFFNKSQSETIEPELVDTEEQQIPKANTKVVVPIEKETELVAGKPKTEKDNPETKTQLTKDISEPKYRLQQKQKALTKRNNKTTVAQTEVKINTKESVSKPIEKLSYEDIKILEVVAQVQELKKANNTVSDAEINALLNQAQKEIALNKLYNKITKKVDANALLQDVEADLEQSFRDRAFKAIKSGYNYLKTAVAERDN
ncbi:MAG: hypothetical protein IIC74_12215 [Bacteroidetes bacterium]|nr:hypothetical protein [Bacteroidota bacterium]